MRMLGEATLDQWGKFDVEARTCKDCLRISQQLLSTARR
jgi:hypothetical protein